MTMIVNNSNRTLKIAGVQVGPQELAQVDASAKSLKEHLFVRSGLIEVSGGGKTAQPQKAEPEKAEESDQSRDE